ncbi:Hypothetical protein, putative [Bodo saltans]|uniref:Uncharacterized protein n=1 Tax=Bodo saltans TaxID=75058 RepID=A0A0S4IK64_BODSA|nr:Hypothetical protein, putative [Bodo saltans]|eukprot:CUE63614.1 Hypothetical protein, putative [Bodo saltans]
MERWTAPPIPTAPAAAPTTPTTAATCPVVLAGSGTGRTVLCNTTETVGFEQHANTSTCNVTVTSFKKLRTTGTDVTCTCSAPTLLLPINPVVERLLFHIGGKRAIEVGRNVPQELTTDSSSTRVGTTPSEDDHSNVKSRHR